MEHYQKENPHHLFTQGGHVKANKCNHIIRVSWCVTSLYPGVFVCLLAFPLCGTSEVVKFFWGRVGGYDFEAPSKRNLGVMIFELLTIYEEPSPPKRI